MLPPHPSQSRPLRGILFKVRPYPHCSCVDVFVQLPARPPDAWEGVGPQLGGAYRLVWTNIPRGVREHCVMKIEATQSWQAEVIERILT